MSGVFTEMSVPSKPYMLFKQMIYQKKAYIIPYPMTSLIGIIIEYRKTVNFQPIFFTFIFLTNISRLIFHPLHIHSKNILMQGTLSQIFNLGFSFVFISKNGKLFMTRCYLIF